jgi:hypothetical protein
MSTKTLPITPPRSTTIDGKQPTSSHTDIDVPVFRSPLKSPRQKSPRTGKEQKQEEFDYNIAWHTLPISEVFRLLETNPNAGITETEVLHRQTSIFGKNIMTPPRKISFIGRYVKARRNIHTSFDT